MNSPLLLTKTAARKLEEQVARLNYEYGFFHANELTQTVSWMSQVNPTRTHREPFLVFALDTLPQYLRQRFGPGVTGFVQPHVIVREFFLTSGPDKFVDRIQAVLAYGLDSTPLDND